jgi:hypothetical protein
MIAEGVADAAGCEDHALLLDENGGCRGLGYNRYQQACPGDGSLSLAGPTQLPTRCFGRQRVVSLACGGGCSAAVGAARDTLAACCIAVLQTQIEAGDVERTAELLAIASSCDTPALAPLANAADACCRRRPVQVAERCAALGMAGSVNEALKALAAMRVAGAPEEMQL